MDTQKHEEDDNRSYGDRDSVVPYAIGGGVFVVFFIALHTVGDRVVHFSTTLALIALLAWLATGVWLVLINPIIIWVPMQRKRKWLKFFLSIIVGLAYFVLSGVAMANFSLPI